MSIQQSEHHVVAAGLPLDVFAGALLVPDDGHLAKLCRYRCIAQIVEQGNDPRLGARPMRRALQRAVEDTIAQKILRGETSPGDHVVLDASDLTV